MINREGFPVILGSLGSSLLAFLIGKKRLGKGLLGVSALSAYFFRDPPRDPVLHPELIISPADGKIVECEVIEKKEWYPEPLWRIAIFMRLWDVHINRSPVIGKVLKISYFKGEKSPAFTPDSFEKNEKQIYLIEREDGLPFWVVQIAGVVARRIKSFVLPGDDVVTGNPIGIIKFGSRVEVFFPAEGAEIYVKRGHRVLAGETVLGRLSFKSS